MLLLSLFVYVALLLLAASLVCLSCLICLSVSIHPAETAGSLGSQCMYAAAASICCLFLLSPFAVVSFELPYY